MRKDVSERDLRGSDAKTNIGELLNKLAHVDSLIVGIGDVY